MKNNVVFEGFEPSDLERVLAKRRYDLLYNIVPCDAIPNVFVEKSDSGFRGTCEVISSQKTFSVKAKGAAAEDVINNLYKSLEKELKDWKKVRFL